jgi:hypothetical protein
MPHPVAIHQAWAAHATVMRFYRRSGSPKSVRISACSSERPLPPAVAVRVADPASVGIAAAAVMLGHGGKQRDRDVTVRVRRLRDLDRRRTGVAVQECAFTMTS